MKLSPYTITAPTADNRTLLFNTSTGAFASADQDVMDCLNSCEGPYIEALLQAGFLSEDPEAERNAQFEIFETQRADTSYLKLSLIPTYACNCRCVYCYESDKEVPWTFMPEEVEEAIYAFVAKRFEEAPFGMLAIEWYGGDPQLGLDLVARMAAHFQQFCLDNEILYSSSMLSNCTRIGEAEAKLIAEAGVSSILVTLDGPEEEHNLRRPSIDGGNDYAKVITALKYLTQEGVVCNIICNSDKINLPKIPELQKELDEMGLYVTAVRLNDYGHFYGTGCFCAPRFDLYSHDEFCQANHDLMKELGQLTRDSLKGMLSACDHFCTGQKNNYFLIDNVGDVYKCDGRVGDKTYALFNVLDEGTEVMDNVSFNPCTDQQCSSCAYLPLCWGNCRWERLQCGMPCHPMKVVGADYLNDYAACFPAPEEPFTLFV